jgi:hypothetical protein
VRPAQNRILRLDDAGDRGRHRGGDRTATEVDGVDRVAFAEILTAAFNLLSGL